MSKIRDFVVGLPAACGVPEGLAEMFGRFNGDLFDFELNNPDGPLNRKNFNSPWDRLALAVSGWRSLADDKCVNFALALLVHASKTIDFNSKGIAYSDMESVKTALTTVQKSPGVSKVAALLTVDQVTPMSSWA